MVRFCSAINCSNKDRPENRQKGITFHRYDARSLVILLYIVEEFKAPRCRHLDKVRRSSESKTHDPSSTTSGWVLPCMMSWCKE